MFVKNSKLILAVISLLIVTTGFVVALASIQADPEYARMPNLEAIKCISLPMRNGISEYEVTLIKDQVTVKNNLHLELQRTFKVSVLKTDENTKGYMPGFLIARGEDFSMSLSLKKKRPYMKGTFWSANLDVEQDGVILKCR
jgi:hypothetical protein